MSRGSGRKYSKRTSRIDNRPFPVYNEKNAKGCDPVKKTLLALMLLCALLMLTACGNRSLLDTHYNFDYAMISMPDGTVVEGKVDTWHDFQQSDQLQVTIGGVTYLTHSTNVVLMSH